jgi:hypothetical protein
MRDLWTKKGMVDEMKIFFHKLWWQCQEHSNVLQMTKKWLIHEVSDWPKLELTK